MPFTPIAPRTLKGDFSPALFALAQEVCFESAQLAGGHTPKLLETLTEKLRIINSYYSNRIESEGTHPLDIEKAMRQEFAKESQQKRLQMLSIAHIQVQKELLEWLQEGRFTSAYDAHFVQEIHRALYTKPEMDSFLKIDHGALHATMIPGQFRDVDVAVGAHQAPQASSLPHLMQMYSELYRRVEASTLASKLIYALASHHRLVWIHPFVDGNGRVSRLALNGLLAWIGLRGYGLWSISRGLARDVDTYKKMLSHADMPRQGALDGKGALSTQALESFVLFMLETARDQIAYMRTYLQLDTLTQRLERYVTHSQNGLFDTAPLPKKSEIVFKHLLLKGEAPRGEIASIASISPRSATTLIQELLQRNYLSSPSPKGAISLAFPAHMMQHLFPEL